MQSRERQFESSVTRP
nr:unnamed protein product [Callosobruchus chinensis]